MGAIVDFEWDSRDMAFWRGNIFDKSIERAMRMAGNKVIQEFQNKSVEHVISRKNLTDFSARASMPIIKPDRKEVLRRMTWIENVSADAVPLSRFPFYQAKAGIVASVNKGTVARIRHAFVARMPKANEKQDHGHLGIFLRAGKERYPIRQLYTSRYSDVMQDQGVIPRMQADAIAKLATAFERGLERELRKLRMKGEI